MNKKILAAAILCAASMGSVKAGGFLTNTNAGPGFLRFPAQEAMFSIESAYYSPAAIGFLNAGWHLGIYNQSAFQTRTVQTTFPAFAFRNGQQTHKFKGTATAPILPAIDLAYVKDRFFGSFHFGVIGGGGKCEFEDGLGSFESIISVMPTALNGIATAAGMGSIVENGYDVNMYMRARQYYFGAQIGLGYKITDKLSVSLGGRLVYGTANYYGYIRDINFTPTNSPLTEAGLLQAGQPTSAANVLNAVGRAAASKAINQAVSHGMPLEEAQAAVQPLLERVGGFSNMLSSVDVNCDQTAWGFAPIIGLAYKNGPLQIGAKYEFKTRMRLKNSSATTAQQAALLTNLAEYEDGREVAADIPALLAAGVSYAFTPRLRAGLSAHYFFDKDAHQHGGKQKRLKGNTWELLAGVEYDVTDRLTASIGAQSTNYGLGKDKAYITDASFVTSSYSLGAGVKFKASERVSVSLAYFKTLYYSTTKTQQDFNGISSTLGRIGRMTQQMGLIDEADAQELNTQLGALSAGGAFKGTELFDRTNDVIGVGVEIHF